MWRLDGTRSRSTVAPSGVHAIAVPFSMRIATELAFQLDALDFVAAATHQRTDEMRAILVEHLRRCLVPVGDDRTVGAAVIPRPSVRSGTESY